MKYIIIGIILGLISDSQAFKLVEQNQNQNHIGVRFMMENRNQGIFDKVLNKIQKEEDEKKEAIEMVIRHKEEQKQKARARKYHKVNYAKAHAKAMELLRQMQDDAKTDAANQMMTQVVQEVHEPVQEEEVEEPSIIDQSGFLAKFGIKNGNNKIDVQNLNVKPNKEIIKAPKVAKNVISDVLANIGLQQEKQNQHATVSELSGDKMKMMKQILSQKLKQKPKTKAELEIKAEAETKAQEAVRVQVEARAEAEVVARAEEEAQAEVEARANEARVKAEVEAEFKAEYEAKAKAELEAKAQATKKLDLEKKKKQLQSLAAKEEPPKQLPQLKKVKDDPIEEFLIAAVLKENKYQEQQEKQQKEALGEILQEEATAAKAEVRAANKKHHDKDRELLQEVEDIENPIASIYALTHPQQMKQMSERQYEMHSWYSN